MRRAPWGLLFDDLLDAPPAFLLHRHSLLYISFVFGSLAHPHSLGCTIVNKKIIQPSTPAILKQSINMLGRTVFAATLFALAQSAATAPPACLLAAAGQYNNPATLKMVCESKDMKSLVATICPNDVDAAVAAIGAICNGQGANAGKYTAISRCSRCVERTEEELGRHQDRHTNTVMQPPTYLWRPPP